MTYKEVQACYRQAKQNSKGISDLWKQFKFEIFLLEQEKSDFSKK